MRQAALLLFLLLAHCAPAKPVVRAAPPAVAESPSAPPGVVATFVLVNETPRTLGTRVVSFGQVFPPGQVRPGARLSITLDGAEVASQMDAKAQGPDGTVRHAVISIEAPALPAGAARRGVIRTTVERQAQQPLAASPPPRLDLALAFADAPTHIVWASLDPARAAGARRGPAWLAGPLVREQRYEMALGRGLQAQFDVWTPVIGPSRVDLILRNDAADLSGIAVQRYDVDFRIAGRPAYRVQGLQQPPYTTWRRRLWSDGGQPPRIVPDTRLLMQVGATPAYGRVSPDLEAARTLHREAMADARPLGLAGVTRYMPTTGGRPDIGPLPAWAVFYLLDPSRENQETLLANAAAAGSIPWHVRDRRTGGPIRIDEHPEVWLDDRGPAAPGVLAQPFRAPEGASQPDDAHQPSLSYLAYVLTGSQYDRDELAMQAAYVLLAINPAYRGPRGLVLGSQVRAVAWDLRTLATAAFILPTDDPLQAYFEARLRDNLRAISSRYVTGHDADAAGELRGYLPGPYGVADAVAPWQQDYLVMVLGWIDGMGFGEARPLLAWMTNFVAGRFTSADRGYDPIYGTPYFLFVADPVSHAPLKRWGDAFQATFDPLHRPVASLDYPGWGGGYAALARGSLATLVSRADTAQARRAFAFVKAHTPGMEASYRSEPTFAIAPESP